MSIYNYFGITTADVVSYFPSAILSDFGSGLTKEMDLQEADLISHFSPRMLKLLEQVEGVKVRPYQVAGQWYINPPSAFLPDVDEPITGFYYSPITTCNRMGYINQNKLNCNGLYQQDCEQVCIYSLQSVGVESISGQTQVCKLIDYDGSSSVYISYTVDKTLLNLPSLGKILRDKICCAVGNALYSRPNESWDLITLACDLSNKAEEMLDSRFIAPEYKREKWINSPIPQGWTTIRTSRG